MAEMIAQLSMTRALILGGLFASLFYFFMYDDGSSRVTAISDAHAQVKTMQDELKTLENKLAKAHEYQRSAAEMGEALNRLLSYIPEQFRLQDFMKMVSEEAKVAGLNIIRINEVAANNQQASKDFEELTVNFDFEGTFAQQLTFLSNLTKQRQIFTVDRFRMDKERATVEQDVPSVSFKGDIRAYRYVGDKAKL